MQNSFAKSAVATVSVLLLLASLVLSIFIYRWQAKIVVDNSYSGILEFGLNKPAIMLEMIRLQSVGKGFVVRIGPPKLVEDKLFVQSFANVPIKFATKLEWEPQSNTYVYKIFFRDEAGLDYLLDESEELSEQLSQDLRERAFYGHRFGSEKLILIFRLDE